MTQPRVWHPMKIMRRRRAADYMYSLRGMNQKKFVHFFSLGMIFFWTLAVIFAYYVAHVYLTNTRMNLVQSMARIAMQRDISYRHLFTSLNKIYVPQQSGVEPNPYLKSSTKVAHTTDGQELVQLNPAYLTRLFFEQDKKYQSRGDIISLNPVNPANSPDEWQEKALRQFRKGKTEAQIVQKIDDKRYLRLMQPLRVKEECLKCHAKHGYQKGDIRGGMNLDMPLTKYEKAAHRDRRMLFWSMGLIWLAGTCGLAAFEYQLNQRIREQDRYEEKLRYLSFHDSLTGLYNRLAFDYEMERLQKGRYNSVGILVCDVDGLKWVNDELGHEQGDKLIQTVSIHIAASLRQGDMVARVGGDEFAVLLPDITEDECHSLQDRIRQAIDTADQESDLPLSLSMGCAIWKYEEHKDMHKLFGKADDRMYEHKRNKSSRRV